MNLLQLFKGLSDPVRLRIANLLIHRGELCVCHITGALCLPQSTVSRHLNTLKSSGLVVACRKGKWVYYRIDANREVAAIGELIRDSALLEEQLQQDLRNLKQTAC